MKIPYARHSIFDTDLRAVSRVLNSEFLTQGPVVGEFEEQVSCLVGVDNSVAVNSATSALFLAYKALGLGPGDFLWTSPNTFVATANCALHCGAEVDFVDIDAATYNMCLKRLEEKLKEASRLGRLPKIVVPVHYAGQPCDMAKISELSAEFGFKIVEDASHAIGARYDALVAGSVSEHTVGSCAHSDITVFSFHPAKIATAGEGGIATTNNYELARQMYRLRTHGITFEPDEMVWRDPSEIWNYQQIDLGCNFRMTDVLAALGCSQLARVADFISRRHEIAKRYEQGLKSLKGLILPYNSPGVHSSFHLYPVRVTGSSGTNQKAVWAEMHRRGIGVNVHYIPVHRQPYYEKKGFKKGYCPEAENFFKEVLTLPMYYSLKDPEIDYVMDALFNAFEVGLVG